MSLVWGWVLQGLLWHPNLHLLNCTVWEGVEFTYNLCRLSWIVYIMPRSLTTNISVVSIVMLHCSRINKSLTYLVFLAANMYREVTVAISHSNREWNLWTWVYPLCSLYVQCNRMLRQVTYYSVDQGFSTSIVMTFLFWFVFALYAT